MAESLLERFNFGKVSAMMTLYEPEAVLIAKDGRILSDHTETAAELERDLSLGLPLEAKARHVFVAGDIAQIVLDWSVDGSGPPTASTCTSEARQAMSCAAARMDSGGS